MNPLAPSLLLLSLLIADGPPKPKFPISKETTVVTGPLDKDGEIHFEAAINERLGKGIKPENNAYALFWRMFGPDWLRNPEPSDEFFRQLGIKKPPKDGGYFVNFHSFMTKAMAQVYLSNQSAFHELRERIQKRPWTSEEFPLFAEWLRRNESPLRIALDAIDRPDFYIPLVSQVTEKGRTGLISVITETGTLELSEIANTLRRERCSELVKANSTQLGAICTHATGWAGSSDVDASQWTP